MAKKAGSQIPGVESLEDVVDAESALENNTARPLLSHCALYL